MRNFSHNMRHKHIFCPYCPKVAKCGGASSNRSMGVPPSDCIFCRKSIPYFQGGDKRWTKINRRNGPIMVTITNFLADPPWVVYILGELCYTKTTIAVQFGEKRANAADSVPELRTKAALGLIGDALAVTGRKARTKRKQDVKGERISHLPRRSRAGAEGPSVCFPCTGTVFRHASRDTKSIKVHLYYSKRSYYG